MTATPGPRYNLFMNTNCCPQCGGELIQGYGLAGGGCGPYQMCIGDEDCGYFTKEQDSHMGYDTLEEKEQDRD